MALTFTSEIDENNYFSLRSDTKIGISRDASSDLSEIKIEIYEQSCSLSPAVVDTLEFKQSGAVEEFDINLSEVLKTNGFFIQSTVPSNNAAVIGLCARRSVKLTVVVGASSIDKTLNFYNNANFNNEIISTSAGNNIPLYGYRWADGDSIAAPKQVYLTNPSKVVSVPIFINPNIHYDDHDINVHVIIKAHIPAFPAFELINSDENWIGTPASFVYFPVGQDGVDTILPIAYANYTHLSVEVKYTNAGVVYARSDANYYPKRDLCYALNQQKIYFANEHGMLDSLIFASKNETLDRKMKDVELTTGDLARIQDKLTKSGSFTSFPVIGDESATYEQLMLSPYVYLADSDLTEILLTSKKLQRSIHNNKEVKINKIAYKVKNKIQL